MSIAVRRNYILKTCFDYLENCIISDGFYFIWSKNIIIQFKFYFVFYRLLSMRMPKSSSFSVRDILDLPRPQEGQLDLKSRTQAGHLKTDLPRSASNIDLETDHKPEIDSSFSRLSNPCPTSSPAQPSYTGSALNHGRGSLGVTSWPMISPIFSHHNCKF